MSTLATPLTLHTPLVDILGCQYPILCAGMGGVARAELAAAVSEAGGFGCMGMVRESAQFIREQIEQYRTLSKRAFGVNIIPFATTREVLEQQIATLIDMQVPAACLFWDVMPEVVQRFKQVGITVIHQVGSAVDADKAVQAGADILIVQGIDAGGHVWGKQNVYALLPEICRICPVPVVAAGGIATGQSIAAAMLLGAQGVSCGSAFLATFESNAHSYHKQRIIEASADDTLYTEVFHINWPKDAPVRVLRNSVTESCASEHLASKERVQIAAQDGQPVYLFSTDSPLRGATGELEKMALYAGRSCGDITAVCSAAERVQQLVGETVQSMERLRELDALDAEQQQGTELSSSPCMASEFNGAYSGQYEDDELYNQLVELHNAGRAIAKACAFSLAQAGCGMRHAVLMKIHSNVIRNCEALLRCIEILQRKPIGEATNYFAECMAIADFTARMQFVKEEQSRLGGRISAIVPKIAQHAIFTQLKTVRVRHDENVQLLEKLLQE